MPNGSPEFLGEEGVADPMVKERMDYALELGGEAFLCTMKHENGTFDHTRKHEFSPPHYLCWNHASWEAKRAPDQLLNQWKCKSGIEGYFWKKHHDYGFGISNGYNAHLFADDRFMTDWKWQMEEAHKIWKEKPYRFHAWTKHCTNFKLK